MTTSTEAARILRDHLEHALLDELGATVVSKVEVLEPAPANQDWAHAALVVHLTTGERFGLEVCPFPRIPAMPTGTVRSMTTEPENPTDVQAPTDEPPVPVEPPYNPAAALAEPVTEEEILGNPPFSGDPVRLREAEAMERAQHIWAEAEGFLPVLSGGWTFRVGGGYASITETGRVAMEPQGTRSDAERFMR